MRRFTLLLLLIAAPTMAMAQTWPGWPGPPPAGYDPQAAAAEQHRQAIEQLRLQADQREQEARQQRLQSDLAIQQLQADRPPLPAPPPPVAYAPARAAVMPPPPGAAQNSNPDPTARSVDQIDAWLARQPH